MARFVSRLPRRTTLLIAFLFASGPSVLAAPPVYGPPTANLALTSNQAADYLIGQPGDLQGEGIDPDGDQLTFSWTVVAGPAGDPDHQNQAICPSTTAGPGIRTCTIPARFFRPDDVGSWTVRLTVSDGVESDSADLQLTVRGFATDQRSPTQAEGDSVNPIREWQSGNQTMSGIRYDDWSYRALLEYTQVPGLSYWDDDPALPNGRGEDHYMQPALARTLERLAELAQQEGLTVQVNDAWDADGLGHAGLSRHYEGRAVDLEALCNGCSPQADQSNLGRLSYLAEKAAQQVGAQYWVWFEFNHVHLSVSGPTAGPYSWGRQCERCLAHQEQGSEAMSGAAAGAMLLEWFLGPGVSQGDLFSQAGSPGQGISCQGLAEVLNNNSPLQWSCSQSPSAEQAYRTLAFWIDWTADQFGEAFPAAIPLQGDYRHWQAVEGAIASAVPRQQGTTEQPWAGAHEVGGFWIDDPAVSTFGRFPKRFLSSRELGARYTVTPGGAFEVLAATGCQGSGNNALAKLAGVTTSGYCGQETVSIVSPADGASVPLAQPVSVSVSAPTDAQAVRLEVTGGSSETLEDTAWPWLFSWTPKVQGLHLLRAVATLADGRIESSPTISVYADALAPIIQPPGELNVGQAADITVQAPGATQVALAADGVGVPLQRREGDEWVFRWTPPSAGGHQLSATATYSDGTTRSTSLDVTVIDPGQNIIVVWITSPKVGATAPSRRLTWVNVESPGPIRRFELRIQDPTGATQTQSADLDPCQELGCHTAVGFPWVPTVPGTYRLQAYATNPSGLRGWTDWVQVQVVDIEETITINQHAFLRVIPGLKGLWRGYPGVSDGNWYDTGIPTGQYACGVVGFAAVGGDIGEETPNNDIIDVYVAPRNGTWRLMADFNTWNKTGFLITYREDRQETWEVRLLCVSTQVASTNGPQPGKPFFLQEHWGLGDNVVDRDIGRSPQQYLCGVVGFGAWQGDIQEDDAGDILQTYLERKHGSWFLRADFRSQSPHENWQAFLLCIDRSLASLNGPVPGVPYFLLEMRDLGDNLGAARQVSTGISAEDYVCGVIGWAARDGDIDEGNKGSSTSLAQVFAFVRNGEWHLRADFRTHKNHESWDVNVLCALRQGAAGVPANRSQPRLGPVDCMSRDDRCQVLTDEVRQLSGLVIVEGGGYSGNPTSIGQRCLSTNYIEVYINDRDPGSGRPLWSWPDKCVAPGGALLLEAGHTYDFRGVSVIGATPLAFELRNPFGPVELTGAVPTEFPSPWGPGMALTWKPTLHPSAKYYEVQFSEDDGANWQVYTTTRDISLGGWINHHGNLSCGQIYTLCLKSAQRYSYRVRVLNRTGVPLTGWSNVLSAVSLDWSTLNDPPQIVDTPSWAAGLVGDTISFTVTAVDPEGGQVTLLADGLPAAASLGPVAGIGTVTATFSWVPDPADVGMHMLQFTARDALGALSATWTTVVNVCDDQVQCLH